jgi:hypothetical protein
VEGVTVKESVEVLHLPAGQRDAEVAKLAEPWIGDEGPLDAELRRGAGDPPLRPRGIAFDEQTTVVWDEDGVQVLRAGPADAEVVALRSEVLLRTELQGPERLFRVDYLRRGTLLGSRFTTRGGSDA